MEWNYLYISNFNGAAVEVWEWISNFFPQFTAHVISYPCWNQKLTHSSKRGPCWEESVDHPLHTETEMSSFRWNFQNDNFQCSQWLKFRQNDDIFVSVHVQPPHIGHSARPSVIPKKTCGIHLIYFLILRITPTTLFHDVLVWYYPHIILLYCSFEEQKKKKNEKKNRICWPDE